MAYCREDAWNSQRQMHYQSMIRHDIEDIRGFDFYELQTYIYDVPIGSTYQGYKGSCLVKDRDADGMNRFEVTEHEVLDESECEDFVTNIPEEEYNQAIELLLFNMKDITRVDELAGGYEVYINNEEKGIHGQYTVVVENVYNNSSYVASKIYGNIYTNDRHGCSTKYFILLDNFEYFDTDDNYTY